MCDKILITEEMLNSLRESLCEKLEKGLMSEKRFRHTIEVEKMAVTLGEIFLPDKINLLRAAALLHDITKEYSFEMQIKLCAQYDLDIKEENYYAPKTLHAITAAACIEREYPEFASEEVIGCVRWHTTGRADMELSEKLIYLADYIDMSRDFEDCVRLRNYFFGADMTNLSHEEKLNHLDDTLIMSYNMTISGLAEGDRVISSDTVAARNALILAKKKRV